MRPQTANAQLEVQYQAFLAQTKLGYVIIGGIIGLLTTVGIWGPTGFTAGYYLFLVVPIAVVLYRNWSQFMLLVLGNLEPKRVLKIGLLPAGIVYGLYAALVVNLSLSYHNPTSTYVGSLADPSNTIAVLLVIPFIEEVIFRLWLQTVLQRWLGIVGAFICAALFVSVHLHWSISLVAISAFLTFLRWRYKSLGTTILAHYVVDITLVTLYEIGTHEKIPIALTSISSVFAFLLDALRLWH